MELVQPLIMIFWSFFLILAYCEFAEKVSMRFDEINDIIGQLEWHSFPHETQKMLTIIMQSTQKTVQFNGFGNISFSRETFKRVNSYTFLFNFDFFYFQYFNF